MQVLNLTKQSKRKNVNTSDNEWKSTRTTFKPHFITEHNLNYHNSEHNIARLDFGALLKSIIGSLKSIIGSSLLH